MHYLWLARGQYQTCQLLLVWSVFLQQLCFVEKAWFRVAQRPLTWVSLSEELAHCCSAVKFAAVALEYYSQYSLTRQYVYDKLYMFVHKITKQSIQYFCSFLWKRDTRFKISKWHDSRACLMHRALKADSILPLSRVSVTTRVFLFIWIEWFTSELKNLLPVAAVALSSQSVDIQLRCNLQCSLRKVITL